MRKTEHLSHILPIFSRGKEFLRSISRTVSSPSFSLPPLLRNKRKTDYVCMTDPAGGRKSFVEISFFKSEMGKFLSPRFMGRTVIREEEGHLTKNRQGKNDIE